MQSWFKTRGYSVFPLWPTGCQTACKMISGLTNWFCLFTTEISEPPVSVTLKSCCHFLQVSHNSQYMRWQCSPAFPFCIMSNSTWWTAVVFTWCLMPRLSDTIHSDGHLQLSCDLSTVAMKIQNKGCSDVGGNISTTMLNVIRLQLHWLWPFQGMF